MENRFRLSLAIAAAALAAASGSALYAQAGSAPYTVVETGQGFNRLQAAVDAAARWFSPLILTAGPFNLILYGCFPEQLQHAFTWLEWLEGSVVAAAVLMLGGLFALRRCFPPRSRPTPATERLNLQQTARGPLAPVEAFAALGCLLFIVALCSAERHNVHPQLIALGLVTGYFALNVLGTEQINLDIDWKALLLLGFVSSCVHMSSETGLAPALLSPSQSQLPDWLKLGRAESPALLGTLTTLAGLAAVTALARLFVPACGVILGALGVVFAGYQGIHPFIICFVVLTFGQHKPESVDAPTRRFERWGEALRAVSLVLSVPYWHALHLV